MKNINKNSINPLKPLKKTARNWVFYNDLLENSKIGIDSNEWFAGVY